jgi:hypothetical protein
MSASFWWFVLIAFILVVTFSVVSAVVFSIALPRLRRSSRVREWAKYHADWFESNKDAIQAASSILGVIAVVFAAAGLLQASQAQVQNTRIQSEAAAANLLQEHLTLSTQYTEFATTVGDEVRTERFVDWEAAKTDPTSREYQLNPKYSWFASHAMFVAQTIYHLMQNQPWGTSDWKTAVEAMIWQHNTFVCRDRVPKVNIRQSLLS